MANRLAVISRIRPRILSQGTVDLETLANRVAKNTTYNQDEIYGMFRMMVREANEALQSGETVKIDGLVSVSVSMKVGGEVKLGLRADRGAVANLNNPQLWTAGKVANFANMSKTSDQLVEQWNVDNPGDQVVE